MRAGVAVTIVVAALPLLVYSNCSSSHTETNGSSLGPGGIDTGIVLQTLQQTSAAIRENKCASCHNASTTDNNLRDIMSVTYLTSNNYMRTGQPQNSSIYLRVIDGLQPPPASNITLTESEIVVLRDWIAAEGGNFDTYIGGTPIDTGGGGGMATFTQVRQLLNQNCVNCHNAGGQAPRLDVDANTLRGAGLVIPNNAAASPLLTAFATMPQGGPFGLNSSQANLVRNWINSGALSN
jgi:uncharacterized membrane protein